ncbi:MAG: DUF2911 domain-containing protein [Candidatus Palauibacterales bacterium]|nr:DUF2911 domain-containing protein [Candidatus Palauibacterales bacterium]
MNGRTALALTAASLLLVAAGPAPAPAQESPACAFQASGEELMNRASPPDSATVQLGGQVAKICYSSPRARGREIMGELVPYGQPWRLGANEPTTLHVTFPAEIGGVRVDPGSYALYAVPGEDQWEIVVNGATGRWGIPIDESVRSEDIGTVTVSPSETGSPVANLTLSFEPRGENEAHLVIEWERTRLRVPVRRVDS